MILQRTEDLDYWFAEAVEPTQPLVLFLHGSGERGTNPQDVLRWGLPKAVLTSPEPSPFHLIAPQCPAKVEWSDVIYGCVDLVTQVGSRMGCSGRKVGAGFSMGGQGVLEIAASHPDLFDSVLAVAPRNTDVLRRFGYAQFEHTNVMIIHGEEDPIVPVSESRAIASEIAKQHGRVALEVLSGKDHFIADEIFGLTNFQRLLGQRLLS